MGLWMVFRDVLVQEFGSELTPGSDSRLGPGCDSGLGLGLKVFLEILHVTLSRYGLCV